MLGAALASAQIAHDASVLANVVGDDGSDEAVRAGLCDQLLCLFALCTAGRSSTTSAEYEVAKRVSSRRVVW
jgi:hypothetical protein